MSPFVKWDRGYGNGKREARGAPALILSKFKPPPPPTEEAELESLRTLGRRRKGGRGKQPPRGPLPSAGQGSWEGCLDLLSAEA